MAVAQSELQLMEEISSYLTVANAEIERLRAELDESHRDRESYVMYLPCNSGPFTSSHRLEQQLEQSSNELTSVSSSTLLR